MSEITLRSVTDIRPGGVPEIDAGLSAIAPGVSEIPRSAA